MYPNLEAELKRKNITRQQLADFLEINVATVSRKMTGNGQFQLSEAFQIINGLLPGMTMEYLFATTPA